MKTFNRILLILLTLILVIGCLAACDNGNGEDESTQNNIQEGPTELVDYASTVKFDPNSDRAYTEATVKTYIDGDTTHFNVPRSVSDTGVLKARYLGINTPESTGQIEPWGKKASNYTKEALMSASSIIIESDTSTWNFDSTGDRYLVWVWYKTASDSDYRCLNLEILQEGLAVSSKSSDTVYADVCVKILNQAVTHKLYVFDKNLKDPDFYYGSAMPITLKELKTNIENYNNKRVSFEGVVVKYVDNTAYIEEYDEESGLYFGMQVFDGYALDSFGLEILQAGNRIRVVGSVQYYETGGTYQISDIKYTAMRPDDESNIKLISQGHTASYDETSAKDFLDGKVTLSLTQTDEDGNESITEKEFDRGFLTMHSSASLTNLTIKSIYTTTKEDSKNKGALSITCVDEEGTEIVVRTAVLKDSDGKTITAASFPIGSNISAKGIVDVYDGVYQLKVFSKNDITFND